MIKRILRFAFLAWIVTCLAACSTDTLRSPCPDFGSWCDHTPVNQFEGKAP